MKGSIMTPKSKLILAAFLGGTAVGLHFISKAIERKQRARREAIFAEHNARMEAIKEWADKTATDLDEQLEAAKFWTIIIENNL